MGSCRFTLCVVAVFFLLSQSVFAQSKAQTAKPPFHFKRYAIQYSIIDFLKFSGYEGSMLSAKYHFNDHSALRIGISANVGIDNRNTDSHKSLDSLSTNNTINEHAYSWTLSIPYLYYFHPQKAIKFYAGIGPRISYAYSYLKSKRKYWDYYTSNESNIRKSTNYKLGLRTLAGVEWFFYSGMSLNLEYGAILQYSYNKDHQTNEKTIYNGEVQTQQNKSKYTNWSLSPKTIYLGLSIYL